MPYAAIQEAEEIPAKGEACEAERLEERFAKTRCLAVVRERLATADQALVAGRPSITVGGNECGAPATTSIPMSRRPNFQ